MKMTKESVINELKSIRRDCELAIERINELINEFDEKLK